MIFVHIRVYKGVPLLRTLPQSTVKKTPENIACGKNPELHKNNDHQVDTVLQSDWQDCRHTTK